MAIEKRHLRIERRHPRVEAGIHCMVGLPDNDLSAGQILDLSAGGLKFSCGLRTIHNILPEHRRTPGLVTGIVVEIHFELQLQDVATKAVKCNARLIHFERLAQDLFHVGVAFAKINKTATKTLHTYLERCTVKQDK